MLNNFIEIILVFILLNIILYCIKHYFNKLLYFYNQLFNNIINIEYYTNNNNKNYFIFSKKCSRPINDYKSILNCALQLLADIYSCSPSSYTDKQELNFIILFVEVDYRTNLPVKLLSDPCFFDYKINNPYSVNELLNLIKWNSFIYQNNLNKVVVSIRQI